MKEEECRGEQRETEEEGGKYTKSDVT